MLLTASGLTARSALFQHRVSSLLGGLAQVQLDRTTRAELLSLAPNLRPGVTSWSDGPCPAEECFSVELKNWPVWPITRWEYVNEFGYKAGYWLGARYGMFVATVELRDAKVHKLDYYLRLDDGTFTYGGVVTVGARSTLVFRDWRLSAADDESPDYRVRSVAKWPDKHLGVDFTPAADRRLVGHAFDVRLSCLWHLRGCQTAKDVLPAVWQDRQQIRQAMAARLAGADPCPDRILPRRAREVGDILLVEVESAYVTRDCDHTRCVRRHHVADYTLVRVLKGKLDRPLKGVAHSLTLFDAHPYGKLPNPALRLLKPGTRVLMFGDNSAHVDSPCEIVGATETALSVIESALASSPSSVGEAERAP